MARELGCGLIGIGRPWGPNQDKPVSTEAEALDFLACALKKGIRFFDTAASYGLSEERLGKFLSQLPRLDRAVVTVATKCGEHYDISTRQTSLDHSRDAMYKSIERSLDLLKVVDIIQLHRPTPAIVRDDNVIGFLRSVGIPNLGVSAGDMATAEAALRSGAYQFIQFSYNQGNKSLEKMFELARRGPTRLIVNRPMNQGRLTDAKEAYGFVLAQDFEGVVLTGTTKKEHLDENIEAFRKYQA